VPAGRWPACSAEDPPDGCRAEVVAEPGEFAVHAAVSPGGFSRASRSVRPRISLLAGGRPGWLG
jgi:hypothetical protein